MTWTWEFRGDGESFAVFDPDGVEVEIVENERGIVNGSPPDVHDVVASHDTPTAVKGDIEKR